MSGLTQSAPAVKSDVQPLSFPPSLFQRIDPPLYLFRHLTTPTTKARPSGRSPSTARQPTLHTAALSHAQGSAVVRVGDTAVVAGVRAEILPLIQKGESKITITPSEDAKRGGFSNISDVEIDAELIKNHCLIVPNIELGTGCSPKFHAGPPGDYAQSVVERWREWLVDVIGVVPVSTLEIHSEDGELGEDGKKMAYAYWVLYIDVLAISLDGGLLEAGWAAIMAALRTTWLPKAYWDKDLATVVADKGSKRPLELRDIGFCSSYAVFRSKEDAMEEDVDMENQKDAQERCWVLADADEFEEGVCEERVLVLRRKSGKVAKLEMGGGRGGEAIVRECLRLSQDRVKTWEKLVGGS
ncbi:hypothetical protein BJ508DRAFT_410807 [Ascobolus immersus RN42]|uniref:Ribosomal RNA-processing protein 43 n=1 Tax=Ascobolus immersus RN42 TaxID=1160509 RepID=A0A3N4J079_ASCIM|nr:hypothetical protein BJ508DRAFT_410807 [Ascobolus immersus RN42]